MRHSIVTVASRRSRCRSIINVVLFFAPRPKSQRRLLRLASVFARRRGWMRRSSSNLDRALRHGVSLRLRTSSPPLTGALPAPQHRRRRVTVRSATARCASSNPRAVPRNRMVSRAPRAARTSRRAAPTRRPISSSTRTRLRLRPSASSARAHA